MTAVTTLTDLGPIAFGLAVAIAAALAAGVFHHANVRRNRHATAWGVATFLAAGIVIPLYFLRYWLGGRRSSS